MEDYKQNLDNRLKRFLNESSSTDSDLKLLTTALIYRNPRAITVEIELSIEQIQQKIIEIEEIISQIFNLFTSAICVSNNSVINSFLLRQETKYAIEDNPWIKKARTQVENLKNQSKTQANILEGQARLKVEKIESQAKRISELAIIQQDNADLIISIINSIKDYDEKLYLTEIHNEFNLQMPELIDLKVMNEVELDLINTQLNRIKQIVTSPLLDTLQTLKDKYNTLDDSLSETNKNIAAISINNNRNDRAAALVLIVIGILFLIPVIFQNIIINILNAIGSILNAIGSTFSSLLDFAINCLYIVGSGFSILINITIWAFILYVMWLVLYFIIYCFESCKNWFSS